MPISLPSGRTFRVSNARACAIVSATPMPSKSNWTSRTDGYFCPSWAGCGTATSRNIQGALGNVTISQQAGKWFVLIQTEREVNTPLPEATSAIGIDMGIARFATFSDGNYLAPLNSFKRHETALRKALQTLSRKERFSRNWRKAKRKVQRLHARR